MKTYNPNSYNSHEIWIYIILIISSVLAAFLAVNNIIIATDSLRYGLAAQEILSGNGLQVPIIRFGNIVPVHGTIPFLEQPPLLPVLLAILGGISPHNYLAGQILNVICHVAITVFTYLSAKKFCNTWVALLTGVLVSISFPMLKSAHYILSEPLFIALTLASVYFVVLSRHFNDNRSGRYLIIAGICAAASISTRYAGIALLGVFFWEAIISIKNRRIASQYKHIIMAAAIPIISIAILFGRNYMILGAMRGVSLPSPDRSYFEAFTGTMKMLFLQFQLGKHSVAPTILFLIFFIVFILTNKTIRKDLFNYFNAGLDSIVIFILGYSMMIFVAMAKDQPYLELRYVYPLVPFLFIATIFVITFVWERIKLKSFTKLPLYGMILSLFIVTFGICYKTYINLPEFFYKQERVYSILNSCTFNWLQENYGKDTIIATNKPYRLSFFGKYSTLLLPTRKWFTNARLPENMENALPNRMAEVESQVLALFKDVKEIHYGNYVTGLYNQRTDNDHFAMLYKCSDGVVYHLK